MFSVKSTMASALLGCAALAMVAPSAAQAGVVVKSSGPSASQYPVGKKLDDQGRITLKTGDSVTVLSGGSTRVISGAGTHRVSARASSKRTAFSALTRNRAAGQVRTGATRGDASGGAVNSPNLWWVDVSKSGTMCVADLSAVQLWRPASEQASTYVLGTSGSAEHLHVAFAADEAVTLWDGAKLPLSEGASYTIAGLDNGVSNIVTFTQLASAPENAEDLAVALLEKGCTAQVELLAEALM